MAATVSAAHNRKVSNIPTYSFGAMIGSVVTGTVFFIFVGTAGLAFLFALSLVPETRGRSPEEIEEDPVLGQKATA